MRVQGKRQWLVLSMLAACLQTPLAYAAKVGSVLPKVAVSDKDGKAEEPWAGKVTLINFWATWCDACKVELKEMEKELAKVSPNQRVVFVSLDKEPAKAKEWMATEFKNSPAMTANLYHDEAFKLADALEVSSFPMTLVVDQQGKILKIQEGFKEGSGTTVALFQAMRETNAK